MAYRRQAANRGSLDWGIVDPALYNEAFAGRAKRIPRCLADTHSSQECRHAPAAWSRRTDVPPGLSYAHSREQPIDTRLPLTFVACLMPQVALGAVSHSAAMHTCAPSADGHTQLRSVVRGASNPPPPAVSRLPLRPRADRPHPLGSSAVLS